MTTTMKSLLLSAALLASSASAQLLRKGIGTLPVCAHSCPILLSGQRSCHGGHSLALSAWSCFCQTVYTNSGSNPAAICPTTCSGSDTALVEQWFTANCGNDNGVSEHDGSASPTTAAGASGSTAPTSTAAGASSTASGVPATDGMAQSNCSGSWFHCHYQWVIMIIVVAVGLIALGFGGRWLKRRHDRRRDQIRQGFNTGVTSRTGNYESDKAAGASGTHRDSPARTRDAFMPYGYGYSRGGAEGSQSEFERGGSPNEMEKGSQGFDDDREGKREKLKRVLGRDGRR